MLDFPFHTECADIITGAFHPQYTVELAIHFDGYIAYMVFDPRAEDALVVIRVDLFGAIIGNTLPEACGDILWLYGEYHSADDFIIYRWEIFRFAERNVSHTFNLLNRPCIAEVKGLRDRAVALGKNIQHLMKTFWINAVRKILCSFYIRDFKECIILHPVSNLFFIKFTSKEVMAVHIKLKLERRSCRNAEIAKPEFFVNESNNAGIYSDQISETFFRLFCRVRACKYYRIP